MLVREITSVIENLAPIGLQESYDNAGLVTGSLDDEVKAVLISLDITEAVLEEALKLGANLIVSHHPPIFKGLKKLRQDDPTARILIKAIKNDLCLYSAHTNLDKVHGGVSSALAERLGLVDCKILAPEKSSLIKLVCYIPEDHVELVSQAIFKAGGGVIGNYDSCSFQSSGLGSFKASDQAKPFLGEKGQLHTEAECRFETILPSYLTDRVVSAMIKAHPYDEVAYDLYPLANENPYFGLGIVGELQNPLGEKGFLEFLKRSLGIAVIRHTSFTGQMVKRVAVCGGSGSEFLNDAIKSGSQVFISGDFKYHQFFEADSRIMIADIGHFESEQFALEIFYNIVTKKMPKFAVHLSKVNTNPIIYF